MRKAFFYCLSTIFFSCVVQYANAQLISITPSDATGDDELTLVFDASEATGGLTGASKVYMHSGVVTSAPDGTDWEYVIGNWGQDDGIGEMAPVDGEEGKWQITLTPREYYNVPAGENIFRLSMVFRDATGANEAKGIPGTYDFGSVASNGDVFVNLAVEAYVNIISPSDEIIFVEDGESLTIEAEASGEVSEMKLFLNDVEETSVSSGTTISYNYTPASSEDLAIKITANIGGIAVEGIKTIRLEIIPATVTAPLPEAVQKGINYAEDETTATLVLEAPGKAFSYVVGDFTNWQLDENYLMNQTPDEEFFWLKIDGLTPGEQYAFQYWVEGTIKIGDPYAALVADPWNDQYISNETFPNIPAYDKTENGVASVLQTGQEEYAWSATEDSWTPPRQDELIIYELLVRDFLGSRNYTDLMDTLSYLKNLGINTIELMPVMEFEGNISWGYNPSYFFAPDKYYGTDDDLKQFIEAAHQKGIAVILDMVLNHAFGQNPMVMMYWDEANETVSENSPWFNPTATHPFNVGFDFNHESTYTQAFVDTVNRYWLEEFHFDGYRFDLSKGFTQTDYGDDVNAWSGFDQGRIDLLNRMADEIRSYDPEAYIILEHFAAESEETELAASDMVLWRNINHNYGEALKGNGGNLSGANAKTHVSYIESHDEQRVAYEMAVNGASQGSYDTQNELVALERLKMAAAFHFLQPGPKMIWQFGELGYDIDINYLGRLGEKPLPWGEGNLGYYEDQLRQYVYDAYAAILKLRNENALQIRTASFTGDLSGSLKQYALAHPLLNLVVIGNFGLEEGNMEVSFPGTGTWFNYFTGEEIDIANTTMEMTLQPGEFHVFTSEQLSEGFPGVVQVYQNPVTVNPTVFTLTDQITVTFDAVKASPDGTAGLVGAEKVYMHAGLITDNHDSEELSHIIGNLTDDGVGEMQKADGEDNKWQITLTPEDYFSVADGTEVFKIGMYFRDAANENVGKGFRDQLIFLDILQEGDIVTVEPTAFSVSDEITITFNAAMGNGALIDADKIYMHSGVVIEDITTPTGDSWTNVVGTWGTDDGVGQMTKVEGTSLWQITMIPAEYYSLSGDAFWLAMVFRNAAGTSQSSAGAGEFNGGFVSENGDIYVSIPERPDVATGVDFFQSQKIHPNPTTTEIYVPTQAGQSCHFTIYNIAGKPILKNQISENGRIDVQNIEDGLYILLIQTESRTETFKVIIEK